VHELVFEGPLDLVGTLGPLAVGASDPTLRLTRREVVRASRTPEGPASLQVVRVAEGRLQARAWGAGGGWCLDRIRDLLGLDEEGVELAQASPALRQLARRARGVRMARTHRVVEALVPIVLQQLVSGAEAMRAFRNLVRTFSEPAPGPFEGLMLPLGPEQLRALPPAGFPPLGVLPRQGRTLCELGWRARRLEQADAMKPAAAERRLLAVAGIGVWSANSVLLRALGHADAVPLGDYNLPRLVAFNLAGEEQADDARMLELLEPYRGQRGRVLRWIGAAGRLPPRRGPRRPLRPLGAEGPALLRGLRPRARS
jgi:3-methyladenine DNA glycosylase/8-oxoguanine DNA glycosylase